MKASGGKLHGVCGKLWRHLELENFHMHSHGEDSNGEVCAAARQSCRPLGEMKVLPLEFK